MGGVLSELMEPKREHEWQSWVEGGEIFAKHLVLPPFVTEVIIEGARSGIAGFMQAKWEDRKQGGLDWQFKALEFYNHAIRHAPRCERTCPTMRGEAMMQALMSRHASP